MKIEFKNLVQLITVIGEHTHLKASEEYIEVIFRYSDGEWHGWVPIVYRRAGLDLHTDDEKYEYLQKVYEELNPKNYNKWLNKQKEFWDTKPNAGTTLSFYNSLSDGKWHCVNCQIPKNPNWARRIQDLKEFGYTIATDINRYCENCKSNKTHLLMLPLERFSINGNGYETWSPALRKRIIKLLNSYDVYEDRYNSNCLPDHKFSEIRWDENTKSENPDTMTDEEIRAKFQLLTNQRNQQKREVCRRCFQTGKRGILYGIPFFYQGDFDWDNTIPVKGKEAEKGCVGCGWYDIEKWKKELIDLITKDDKND